MAPALRAGLRAKEAAMRALVATAEAREAAAKDDTTALRATRSSLLETPRRGATPHPAATPAPAAAQVPRGTAAGAAAGAEPARDPCSDAAEAAPAAHRPEGSDGAAELSSQRSAADGGDSSEPAGERDPPAGAAPDAAAAPHAAPAGAVPALPLVGLASAAAAGAGGASEGLGEGEQGPEAAVQAAISAAEARRAAAKKQFAQLRSVCIGAQQARRPRARAATCTRARMWMCPAASKLAPSLLFTALFTAQLSCLWRA